MKLLERADLICRRRGMSRRTAEVYGQWIRRYLAFSAAARGGWTPPEKLITADVEAFLNHLVGERRLSASSQNQALNALVFLYRHVLENAIPPDHLGKFELLRSTRPARLPTVLSADEVVRLLEAIPPNRAGADERSGGARTRKRSYDNLAAGEDSFVSFPGAF